MNCSKPILKRAFSPLVEAKGSICSPQSATHPNFRTIHPRYRLQKTVEAPVRVQKADSKCYFYLSLQLPCLLKSKYGRSGPHQSPRTMPPQHYRIEELWTQSHDQPYRSPETQGLTKSAASLSRWPSSNPAACSNSPRLASRDLAIPSSTPILISPGERARRSASSSPPNAPSSAHPRNCYQLWTAVA